MLPEISHNGAIGLDIDVVGVSGARVSACAYSQSEECVTGHVVRHLSEQRWPPL